MESPFILAALFVAAVVAGWIDSIAGGGGLITLPALLAAGLPPHLALGTNKFQSSFGSFTATMNHYRRGVINVRESSLGVLCTVIGAGAGAYVVQILDPNLLGKIIPFLLVGILIYFIFSPRLGDRDTTPRIHRSVFFVTVGLGLGFYDGFFGPGTGSFWTFLFVSLMGLNLLKATGYTKLMNFTSNIVSLVVFALGGNIMFTVGIVMAVGQTIGAYIGSHMAITRGAKFIRPVFVIVILATVVKLFADYFN